MLLYSRSRSRLSCTSVLPTLTTPPEGLGGMAEGNGFPSPENFTKARTVAGVILLLTGSVIAIIDALRTDVTIDPIQFFLILGTGALLLGVRGLERFIKP